MAFLVEHMVLVAKVNNCEAFVVRVSKGRTWCCPVPKNISSGIESKENSAVKLDVIPCHFKYLGLRALTIHI